MTVLIIDTALGACTAAVFEAETPVAVRSEVMTKGHQERLGGLVRDAVTEAGGFDGVARIGVTVGPGSFTGLRVGLAFAQGLGAALDRPVVGISTLAALAASVAPTGLVVALIDARRGQVYARLFRDGEALTDNEVWPLEIARERIVGALVGGEGLTLVGSGADLMAAAFPEATVAALAAPTPRALAGLTAAADPAACPPRPIYLRAPDAAVPTRLPGQARTALAAAAAGR